MRISDWSSDVCSSDLARGDAALLELSNRFDRRAIKSANEFEVPTAEWQQAWEAQPADLRAALETAAARIRAYAEHQKLAPFAFTDALGNTLGQEVRALERVGKIGRAHV